MVEGVFVVDLGVAFASIIAVNIIAWATPGPNMVAVISMSVEKGRGGGILTGTGLAFSSLIWAALAVFGGSSLREAFPDFTMVLKLAGATYLAWLGVKSFMKSISNAVVMPENTLIRVQPPIGSLWAFQHGLFIGLTNPKAIFFFGAIVTSLVPAAAPDWFLIVVVLLCGVLGIALHSATATLISTPKVMRILAKRQSLIAAITGIMFCCFAGIGYLQVIQG